MLLPDNTYQVGNSYSAKFLRGLSEVDPLAQAIEEGNAQTDVAIGTGAATPIDTTDWVKIGAAVNAEGVFIANLFRQAAGKATLPANTGPSVNVGLTPQTQKLVVYGGAALLLGLLFLRHR